MLILFEYQLTSFREPTEKTLAIPGKTIRTFKIFNNISAHCSSHYEVVRPSMFERCSYQSPCNELCGQWIMAEQTPNPKLFSSCHNACIFWRRTLMGTCHINKPSTIFTFSLRYATRELKKCKIRILQAAFHKLNVNDNFCSRDISGPSYR